MKKTIIAVALRTLFHRYAVHSGLALGVLALTVDKLEGLDAAVRPLYKEKDGKFILDVSGLPDPEDNAPLKAAITKEREAAKKSEDARKALEKRYEGIDPDAVRALMGQFENAEEAALLAKGKEGIETIINKRTEKQRLEFEKKLKEASDKATGALEVASTYMDRVLDNHVRAAVAKAGIVPSAVDDALLRARNIFSLDDEANAVQFDKDGETVVLGKDAKTPFSVTEWIESMKESAPHWFPAGSSGGGSKGDQGKGGEKTMKRSAFDALGQDERKKVMADKVKLVD